MEDGIPGWLQYCHKICCEKDGHHGRWACMIQRWFHCGDIVSGQVDLYMTNKERLIENTMKVNIFYKRHKEQMEIDVIGSQKWSIILRLL